MALLAGSFSDMISNFNGASGGGPTSLKNLLTGGANAMLGIGEGDVLSQRLKDQEDEMRKKALMAQRKAYPDVANGNILPGGAGMLFGGI